MPASSYVGFGVKAYDSWPKYTEFATVPSI